MNKLTSIFLAARPKTLPAGLVAVWAGCLIVWKFEHYMPSLGISLNWTLAVFTALSCMCLQIASNIFNDAIDTLKHADTERRQGPRRITASGDFSPRTVLLIGACFLAAAAAFAIPLIYQQGPTVIAIGLPCMAASYCYTGGPYPLSYHGLGELCVLVFFGLVAVAGTVFVQIGWIPEWAPVYRCAFIVGVQCGSLSCLLIEVNNIRDRVEDASTGKRTLAVRLGDSRARGLALAFLILPYATIRWTGMFLPGFHWNICWLAAIIVGGVILLKLHTTPANKKMNVMLGLASLHAMLFLLALSM